MLDPNILPTVRWIVAGIAALPVLFFICVFVKFWLEARTFNRTRKRGF